MEDVAYNIGFVFGVIVAACVGAYLGKDRKIGPVWGTFLGGAFGLIGILIVFFCKKKTDTRKVLIVEKKEFEPEGKVSSAT